MKTEHDKKDQTANAKPNDIISITIQVPRGIVHFLEDNAKYIEQTEGPSTVQEYLEEAIWKDFEAQVDLMHLKINEVCEHYKIPRAAWGNSPGPAIPLSPALVTELKHVAAIGGFSTVQQMMDDWHRSGLLDYATPKLAN